MKLLDYIKDKIFSIIIYIFSILFTLFILISFNTKKEVIIIITFINILIGVFLLLYNYYRKKDFYNNLLINLKKLDKKYLILETIPEPTTYEEKIISNIMYEINKSMIENIKLFETNVIDFKEFVEMWIHEVKIPISSLVLKCHNNKDKYTNDFIIQVNKLNYYIDQILYYVRSENTEKDFVINEVLLSDIIKKVSLNNMDDILSNNIELLAENLNYKVNTDSKWLEFILNQIINNCIKYKKEDNGLIKINAKEDKNKIILSIYDNGIGISKKDISNVFNKSFTGDNGRNRVKSTGMGLYIANNLCKKLGHSINIESEKDKYTKVNISFDINKHYKM